MLRALLIVLAGIFVAAGPALAQAEEPLTAAAQPGKLDPEERAALRERYERLRAMSPEERERALTLARRMRREAEATLRSLDPAERAEVEALDPAERSRVLRSLIADRARMMATRLQAHLTDEERAQPGGRRRGRALPRPGARSHEDAGAAPGQGAAHGREPAALAP